MAINDSNFRLPSEYHLASWVYEKVMGEIREFESDLDNDSEIALKLANFGTSTTLLVTDISYQNPELLYFYGYINNKWAEIILNIHQLNFILISVPKKNSDVPPRRIGFVLPSEAVENQQ